MLQIHVTLVTTEKLNRTLARGVAASRKLIHIDCFSFVSETPLVCNLASSLSFLRAREDRAAMTNLKPWKRPGTEEIIFIGGWRQ
jgi:hypothetical protein